MKLFPILLFILFSFIFQLSIYLSKPLLSFFSPSYFLYVCFSLLYPLPSFLHFFYLTFQPLFSSPTTSSANKPISPLPPTPAEILRQVCAEGLRPPLEGIKAAEYVVGCLRECWNPLPEERPDFKGVRLKLKEMQAGL